MRLVEIRLLEGPNVYRLEPTVKLEVTVGRRRTWYGQRSPGRHAVVHLGKPIPAHEAPSPVADIAAWVRRLHAMSGAAAWLAAEGRATTPTRARIPVAIHRSSEPGHWVVAYPWRERGRAETIAEAALRLVELGVDLGARPMNGASGGSSTGRRNGAVLSRSLARALRAIGETSTAAPPWIRDAERRIPAVSISGTNGKSTTTRMITHIMRGTARHVGTTTSDGVLFDERMVEEGDLTGPAGARTVFSDPRVEVAVLETARGGIVLKGIGYESNDASVLTNVSPDHLDLHGIHTLPELAEVKQTVALITRPNGVAVLNAQDPLVAAVARRVRARVCLFSLDPKEMRVRRHVADGGLANVVDDGWLMELEGSRRRRIVRVTEVPSTIRGLAMHNVANALAAAGAARALGATLAQVADGLRTFQPTADQAPGRLNLYLVGERLVIVDFAHNEAGVDVVLDVAEGLVGRKGQRTGFLTLIIGTAGDRPDDTLRGIATIAASRADQVAIKETQHYLRGRTRESMVGEFMEGLRAAGMRTADVPVYPNEAAAVRGELADTDRMAGTGRRGVLVIMCHEDRSGVVSAIASLGGTPVSDVPPSFLGTAPGR